jgi:hypothetical protein
MSDIHDFDPPEYTGTEPKVKAEPPKSKGKPPLVVPVAVYTPPPAGAAHPKHARLSVAQRVDTAEAALGAAMLEITAARADLRQAELAEADALGALIAALPQPTAQEVNSERLAKEQAAKLARVSQGLSPTETRAPTHGHSPIDRAAANRGRAGTGMPLRSPVARRVV